MTVQILPAALKNTAPQPVLRPEEMAAYSLDMLLALRGIAEQNRHSRLAELLGTAAAEAERLVKAPTRRPTSRK